MTQLQKPKAARTLGSKGFTIQTHENRNPFVDSPVTPDESFGDNDNNNDPFVARTPTENASAFHKPIVSMVVGPPEIRRKVRVDDDDDDDLAFPRLNSETEKSRKTDAGGDDRCDETEATSPQTPMSPPPRASTTNERRKKDRKATTHMSKDKKKKENNNGKWGRIKITMPKKIPKRTKKKKNTTRGRNDTNNNEGGPDPEEELSAAPVDLSCLAVATTCIVPRHGAGIAAGRKPHERARTSLVLHMVQECENSSWEEKSDINDKNGEGKVMADNNNNREEAAVSKFDALLRESIASKETSFGEKSQDVTRLAKDALEELSDDTMSTTRTELGQRNLTCVKFLSGMYREVIVDEKRINSRDGLSLMVVANAYYALGKFEAALAVYQRAGIELKKKIATRPEYTVHCAKLFNNMGCVYFEMGKYEKAMQTFQRALQLFHEDGHGDDYAAWSTAVLDQASIMNNMAYALIKFKQFDDASDLVDASFELQQILPAEGTTNAAMTVSSLSTMAFIYYRTKQYRTSLDTYTACVQLQDRSPLCSESDQVEVLKKMADICKKIRDHEKRMYLLRTILVYQQCYLLEDDDEIWDTHAALAETLQAFADSGGTSI